MAELLNSAIADDLSAAGAKAKYDENIRNILSNKSILAWILKYTTDEFSEYDIPKIMECIENPEVGNVRIRPGLTNREKIVGLRNEDKVPNEGEVVYDIRFSVYKPLEEGKYPKMNGNNKENIKLIINVEAQNNFYPGYNIVTRALFYCARLLSAQLGTEFSAEDYDNIKKVYSIFICTDTSKMSENTITSYELSPRSLYGEMKKAPGCDLLRAVMVCVGKTKIKCYNDKKDSPAGLLNLLKVILDDSMAVSDKIRILETEYSIESTHRIREELDRMCNLSDTIEQRGIEKGIERGEAVKLYELVNRYMKKNNCTVEEACDVMGVLPEEYRMAEELVREE